MPFFSSLRLWIDANHDGISQPGEIYTLPALGITAISLSYKDDQRTDQYGNIFRYRAKISTTNGDRMAYDVFFVYMKPVAKNYKCPSPTRGTIPLKAGGF